VSAASAMAYGRGKKAAAEPAKKGTNVPDNAQLLIDRLKPIQMQNLILKKMGDGSPIVLGDILSLLEKAETGNIHHHHDEPAETSQPKGTSPVLERLTTATRIELEADFSQFDKNGDGSITLDEFIQIMHRQVPGHDTPAFEDAELVALFQAMDADGGGTVDYHEFAEQWALDRAEDEMATQEEAAADA